MTDATGHFLLKNLPVGKLEVALSYVGYESQDVEVEILSHKTVEVKFSLRPTSIQMDEVVVTGSRNETRRRESTTIVNIVPAKIFEHTASNYIAEALNYQPGLRVEYNCSNCGVPQLRINGLEGQYSQVLLDSRPIFSSLASVYGLEHLPAGMIERVEVIRGGGSALFGSSAIGGVDNIITKEPLRNSFMVSNSTGIMQGGGLDVNTTMNASLVTDDCRTGLFLFGVVKNKDAYDRNGDGFSDIPMTNGQTIGFRAYHKFNNTSRLTAEYHNMGEFRRGGNKMDQQPHEADIAEQLRHNINGGSLKYEMWSKDFRHSMSLFTSAQHIKRQSYFGTEQNLDAYGKTNDVMFVVGGQYAYQFEKFLFMPSQLTLGVEYTDNKLKDEMLGYERVIDQNSKAVGTYLQNEWKNEKWGILLGGRLDKHNMVEKAIFSPRANVRFAPNDSWSFRLSYSSGYRAPQVYDEDLHVAAVGGEVAIITLSPDLKPEYSNSVSASIDWYRRFGRFETNILLEGFYTNLDDVFALEKIGFDEHGNTIFERRNESGATISGVNMEWKAGFSKYLVFNGGFTLQKSLYKEDFMWSEDLTPQRVMFRSPNRYGYMSLNYTPIKPLSLTFNTTYTGPMLVQHNAGFVENDCETITPDFWDLGFRASYDIRLSQQLRMELAGGVKNILDAFQKDIDEGVDRDAAYIYGPVMPRTFFFEVKINM